MKKTLIVGLMLLGFLGFSQTTKKKVYKKKTAKKTYVKKVTPKKSTTTTKVTKPIETTEVTEAVELQSTVDVAPMPIEKREVTETVEVATTPDYEVMAGKVAKMKGYINNRNSAEVRGVEGFVKGVYSGNGKIYILLEIDNRSNINYDIESSIFITTPIEKKGRVLDTEEKNFFPIYSNQPETISKKSKQKLVYVFDKFTISENKTLNFVLSEIEGEREIKLEIKPKYILEAYSTKN